MLLPGSFLGGRRASTLGSFIFDDNDESLLATQIGTAVDRTRCTISFWVKIEIPGSEFLSYYVFSFNEALNNYAGVVSDTDANDMYAINSNSGSEIQEATDDNTLDVNNTWHHWVVRWDTNQGTSDNRIRFYKDGSFITDFLTNPGSSVPFQFFLDGNSINIGNFDGSPHIAKKMAFIEVIEGQSLEPTEFAFDNGGTWTRKPFTGSYGTHGFRIDGSAGFNDAANGRVFNAATGMTIAANIDTADLPPYTT